MRLTHCTYWVKNDWKLCNQVFFLQLYVCLVMFLKQACLLKEALQMSVYRVPLDIFKKPLVREAALSAHFLPFPIWMTLGMMTLKPKGYLQFCNVVELKSQCWQIRYENNSRLVFTFYPARPSLSPCSYLLYASYTRVQNVWSACWTASLPHRLSYINQF